MLRSSLESGEEAHIVFLDNSKHQEDVKLRTQLPDYGDFQGYDLGVGDTLNRAGRRIFANFHKPSWQTLKHHLLPAETPKELVRGLNAIAENDKKGDFKQGRMFGGVAKIPIANTFSELVEMDFVDYGDLSTPMRARDTLSRFPAIVF